MKRLAVITAFLCLFTKADGQWSLVPKILKDINVPVFQQKVFNITSYGAKADRHTNCSKAIKAAIAACHAGGGGRVLVPAGSFMTGPVYLQSQVELHLEKGARLLFSTQPADYLPIVATRWEGVELMNYSPLVYAYREHDIAITGEGTLDGQADNRHWWPWKGKAEYGWVTGTPNQTDEGKRPALFDMSERNVPLKDRRFGEGFNLRPQFVQPYYCKNVLIEGVTIVNSPMWILHPVLCESVTIKNVRVESEGPNTDGCDPESCKNVLIKNCWFNTGDDCIALKSGRNAEGRRINVPCENVVIQNCTMANGHGGIVIGSEISGGVKNVFAEDCRLNSPLLDRALRVKTSSARGGVTDGVYLRNISVGEVKEETIQISMFYEDMGNYMPSIRNINISDMQVEKGGKAGVIIEGYRLSPINQVNISNLKISAVQQPYRLSNVDGLNWKNVIINGKDVDGENLTISKQEPNIHW